MSFSFLLLLFAGHAFFPALAPPLLEPSAVVFRPVERHNAVHRLAAPDSVVLCPPRHGGDADTVLLGNFFCCHSCPPYFLFFFRIFISLKTIETERRTIKTTLRTVAMLDLRLKKLDNFGDYFQDNQNYRQNHESD